MAVTTIVPDATVSGASLFQLVGGGATVHASINDGSDTTYIQKQAAVVGQADAIVDFGTFTLTASQIIKQVRLRARCSTPTTAGKINVYLGARLSNQNYFFSGLSINGQYASATTFTGPYYNSAPDGTAWTQNALNNLRAKISEYRDTGVLGKIYDLFIDVDVSTKPTVTVSLPSGGVSATTTPDVSWTYVDSTDNTTQNYYQIKVFTAAQYGASGFNATTSTAIYDSGQIASSDQNAVVGSLLVTGTYRCYVRVAKDINGSPFWSDWAYSAFTESYTAPAIPTMAVAWTAAFGYATFTLTGAATGYTSLFYQVERSDDSGVTYTAIDLGTAVTSSGGTGTTYDYEAPRGITAYYRARTVGVDANGNQFPSSYSTIQQVLITNDSTWWFKVPDKPSLNTGSIRVLQQIDTTIEEPTTTFRPLGAYYPVVVAGPIQGEDGTYEIMTITEAEWTALKLIMRYQGILLIQDPFGNQKYIRIIDRTWQASTVNGVIHRDIKLKYVEVNGHPS